VRHRIGRLLPFGKRDHEVDDPLSDLRILDAGERHVEMQALGRGKKIRDIGRGARFLNDADLLRGFLAGDGIEHGRPFEKEGWRNVERPRDLLQPARPDPIRALLVFLHLLKGQAERISELFLAHAEHDTAHAHPTTDMPVDRVRNLFILDHSETFTVNYDTKIP